MKNKDYDTTSIVLARTIGKIRTNIDVMNTIAKYQKTDNDFWDLVFNSLYDLIVIDSFKLVDKKNLSVFSLINEAKGKSPTNVDELDKDYSELQKWINREEFKLIEHRHTQQAHHSRKTNSSLPRRVDFNDIMSLLAKCESLIKKYNKWIKGPKYSTNFNSIYAPGHEDLLQYVSKIIY